MQNITIFRISVFTTFLFFLSALVTPVASIAIDFLSGPDALQSLEFVCVYCQYGSIDNNPDGTALILNLTPFDFYGVWIPFLGLLLLSLVSIFKAFPRFGLSLKVSDRIAVNSLWVLAILGLVVRGLLSILLQVDVNKYKELFPENQIIGELSWAAGALVIGSIMAASSAMIGYIEYLYDMETEPIPISSQ